MRLAAVAAILAGVVAVPAHSAPVAYNATATIVAALGDFNPIGGSFPIPLGFHLSGQWNVDSDFSTGVDRLVSIPSPVASAIIDFSIASTAFLSDASSVPVPGASVTSSVTSLFYYDNVVVDAAYLAGTGLDGFIPYGTYDLFQVVAPETIALQDAVTGEFYPAAPPGEGSAVEVTLTIAGLHDWFSGPQTGLAPLPADLLTVIDVTQYNESGDITGRAVAVNTASLVPAPAPFAFLSVFAIPLLLRRRRAG
jgi:hypothetical protein